MANLRVPLCKRTIRISCAAFLYIFFIVCILQLESPNCIPKSGILDEGEKEIEMGDFYEPKVQFSLTGKIEKNTYREKHAPRGYGTGNRRDKRSNIGIRERLASTFRSHSHADCTWISCVRGLSAGQLWKAKCAILQVYKGTVGDSERGADRGNTHFGMKLLLHYCLSVRVRCWSGAFEQADNFRCNGPWQRHCADIVWVRSYEASAGKLQPAMNHNQINSDHRRLNTDGPNMGIPKADMPDLAVIIASNDLTQFSFSALSAIISIT